MNLISAEIIADSVNTFGNRITTMKLVFPRIVLAEFNTHRAFSRNSASSRAIPFARMKKMVQDNPFIPIEFQYNHSGMQGSDVLIGRDKEYAEIKWLNARDRAVIAAEGLYELGITKQLCNRLLEPFMMHTVLVTATEWENFFALRAHPAAEIHIADLAEKMLIAYNESVPKHLKPGEWHLPFGDKFEDDTWVDFYEQLIEGQYCEKHEESIKVKIATARCARLSYETLGDNPKIDYAADIRLHDTLIGSGHMSPAEHCARAMSEEEYRHYYVSTPNELISGVCGNFRGFKQYRKMIDGENKSDSRVRSDRK